MRWTRSWLSVVASLASFGAGAATTDEVEAQDERGRSPTLRLEAAGYAASGPGFYVWEEDARQGRQWAAELSRGAHASAPGAPPRGPEDLERSAT